MVTALKADIGLQNAVIRYKHMGSLKTATISMKSWLAVGFRPVEFLSIWLQVYGWRLWVSLWNMSVISNRSALSQANHSDNGSQLSFPKFAASMEHLSRISGWSSISKHLPGSSSRKDVNFVTIQRTNILFSAILCVSSESVFIWNVHQKIWSD